MEASDLRQDDVNYSKASLLGVLVPLPQNHHSTLKYFQVTFFAHHPCDCCGASYDPWSGIARCA